MGKGVIVGVLIAILAGATLGYGLSYFFLAKPGNIVQTEFSTSRTVAYIQSTTTSPVQVSDAQLSITTIGGSYLIVRFSTDFTIYLYQNHDGLTRFQVNLTMNGVTKSIHYLEAMPDGTVVDSNGEERSGFLTIDFVTESLTVGTYEFKIMWKSMVSGGTIDSQLIFCSPNFNCTRSFFIQEIKV